MKIISIDYFNKEVALKELSPAKKELWDWWYDYYIIKKDVHDIDKIGITIFLSIMIDEHIAVIDDWFRNPDDYNFETIDIKFQPWFSSDFLVLPHWFPNVREFADI